MKVQLLYLITIAAAAIIDKGRSGRGRAIKGKVIPSKASIKGKVRPGKAEIVKARPGEVEKKIESDKKEETVFVPSDEGGAGDCNYKVVKSANIRFANGGNKATCKNDNQLDCPKELNFFDHESCTVEVIAENETEERRVYTCPDDESAHKLYKDYKAGKWKC
jgi:hypothetical protein